MTGGFGHRGVLDTSTIILLERVGDSSWLPDAAIANDLPLYTCNPGDFQHIEELDLRPIRIRTRPPTEQVLAAAAADG